jgi:hypothetical protein
MERRRYGDHTSDIRLPLGHSSNTASCSQSDLSPRPIGTDVSESELSSRGNFLMLKLTVQDDHDVRTVQYTGGRYRWNIVRARFRFFFFLIWTDICKCSGIVYARPNASPSTQSIDASPGCLAQATSPPPCFSEMEELLTALCPNVTGPQHRHFRWTGHRPASERDALRDVMLPHETFKCTTTKTDDNDAPDKRRHMRGTGSS